MVWSGIFTAALTSSMPPAPAEGSLAWILLGAVITLVVWVYLDNRRHFTQRMDRHDKSDDEKFRLLFDKVERITSIESDIKWIRRQLERGGN